VQSLEVQLDQLNQAGVEKVFQEKVSGAKRDRLQLTAMLDYCREG
jgi:DNA invertase Pin-like site-specific DNA recombinase